MKAMSKTRVYNVLDEQIRNAYSANFYMLFEKCSTSDVSDMRFEFVHAKDKSKRLSAHMYKSVLTVNSIDIPAVTMQTIEFDETSNKTVFFENYYEFDSSKELYTDYASLYNAIEKSRERYNAHNVTSATYDFNLEKAAEKAAEILKRKVSRRLTAENVKSVFKVPNDSAIYAVIEHNNRIVTYDLRSDCRKPVYKSAPIDESVIAKKSEPVSVSKPVSSSRESLTDKYASRKPDATINENNVTLAVWYPDAGDDHDLVAAYVTPDGYKNLAHQTVFHTTTGRSYTRKGGKRYYLDGVA